MPRALCTYRCSFFLAAAIICLAFVFGDPVDAGMREDSLLLTGARSQQLSIVRASLEQGADMSIRDSSGLNAAERAAEEGHFSLSDRLKNMVPPEK